MQRHQRPVSRPVAFILKGTIVIPLVIAVLFLAPAARTEGAQTPNPGNVLVIPNNASGFFRPWATIPTATLWLDTVSPFTLTGKAPAASAQALGVAAAAVATGQSAVQSALVAVQHAASALQESTSSSSSSGDRGDGRKANARGGGDESGALGQLLTSFATGASRTPWLEVHLETASVSFGGHSWETDAPVSMYLDDGTPAADEGWQHGIEIPVDQVPVVEAGVRHFVDVLCGRAKPVLTAEHARHVLDIIVQAYASIEDGRSHTTETRF